MAFDVMVKTPKTKYLFVCAVEIIVKIPQMRPTNFDVFKTLINMVQNGYCGQIVFFSS